ncbi:hypothetical protein VTK56DRAFT_1535 [Thermocarpiscus australiensis]
MRRVHNSTFNALRRTTSPPKPTPIPPCQRVSHRKARERSLYKRMERRTLLPLAGANQRSQKTRQQVVRSNSNNKPSSPPSSPEKAQKLVAPLDRRGQDAAVRKVDKQGGRPPETTTTPLSEFQPGSTPSMAGQQPAPVYSEPLCEGDTTIITNVLPPALAADAFERLLEEVSWAGMSHLGGEVPRRVAVQGAIDEDGSMPVYRHPSDESPPLLPFSPTVLQIKEEVEKHLGHPLNHVLIQHYRSGNDYISEHSDKTLDIVKGSFIANVSLGAERTMVFRTKRPPKDPSKKDQAEGADDANTSDADKARRQVQRAPLPHNSLCRMGLATNERWLHAIRQDKRPDRDKTPAELAYGGARISLTFRRIGTFIDAAQSRIWGQGATAKAREAARPVVNGQTPDAVRLLQAFGAENHSSAFDWAAHYAAGFDVLHMGTPKRVFFCCCAGSGSGSGSGSGPGGDPLASARVALALAELGVSCAKGSFEGGDVRFEDNDPARTVVDGHETVLRYLDAVYGAGRRYDQMVPAEVARRSTRLQRALDLLAKWRGALKEAGVSVSLSSEEEGGDNNEQVTGEQIEAVMQSLRKELADWEGYAREAAAAVASSTAASGDGATVATTGRSGSGNASGGGGLYIAGGTQPSPADYALWPVLHDMVRVCGEGVLGAELRRYYAAFRERSSAAKVLGQFFKSG